MAQEHRVRLWFISDTHFGHQAMLKFVDDAGFPIRSFNSVTEMDEFMVERWNTHVGKSDHVYHLGDVAMRKESLDVIRRLNGKKRLILGNHDIFSVKDYLRVGFEKIFGSRVLDGILFTHFPVHPGSMGRFIGNVHGHIHQNESPPGKYLNISVERTLYRPLSLEEVKQRLEERLEERLEARGSQEGS